MATQASSFYGTSAPILDVVADFGAVGDGVTDDTAAIQAALDEADDINGIVYLPTGVYKTTSALTVASTNATIGSVRVIGDGSGSVIKPTITGARAIVTSATSNSNGTTNFIELSNLRLDGSNASTATGILVGDNAGNLSGNTAIRDVIVLGFAGAGSYGIKVKNNVGLDAYRVYAGRNHVNMIIEGSDTALPTVSSFHECSFREATTIGVKIVNGYRITFDKCLFEANDEEGVKIIPAAAGNAIYMAFNHCWFEDNYNGTATQYHLHADGSAAGATASFTMDSCNFSGTCRAVYAKSAVNTYFRDLWPQNAANQIVIDTGCIGGILSHAEANAPLNTVLNNGAAATFTTLISGWQSKMTVLPADGHLKPLTTATYDLGTSSNKFRAGYFSGAVSAGSVVSAGTITPSDAIVGGVGANLDAFIQPGGGSGYVAIRDSSSNEVLKVTGTYIECGQELRISEVLKATKGDSTGAPGNATLNTPQGQSAIAAAATACTITSNLCTSATTNVFVTPLDNDATLTSFKVVATNGSFTVTGNAAATATWKFAWLVVN